MNWLDEFPHSIYASVSLIDGKITGWKVGDRKMDCGSSNYGGGEIVSKEFIAKSKSEHNDIFANQSEEWFKQWPIAEDFRGCLPYKTEAQKYYEEFIQELAQVFNDDSELWSCEYCKWVDCDERICGVCKAIINKKDNAKAAQL